MQRKYNYDIIDNNIIQKCDGKSAASDLGKEKRMPEQNNLEEIKQIWEIVKNSFINSLPQSSINLWFGDIEILSFSEDTIVMGQQYELRYRAVRDRYLTDIEKKFKELLGFPIKIDLRFTGSASAADVIGTPVKQEPVKVEAQGNASRLINYNFEYTFDNFIVGSTNKFAHAACLAVSRSPAENYNPLFIYGNSGLGKTHLMNAIVNEMRKKNPKTKAVFTTGEEFTNQMIACLANKTMEFFRNRFRNCDILLIDDIQFIAGKVATQEEFFYTFNALYDMHKQIVMTSDRPPRDIKTLEDRLKTRFEWGLIADIEPPDLELRIAIIKNKAEQCGVRIPDDVLTYLGENLRSNIRQIEGAIKKLGALSFLSGKVITMELAQECTSELLGSAEPVNVTVDKIFSVVSDRYGIPKEDMTGPKRQKEITNARHVTVYLIREITEMSLPNIAKVFNRDHSTIMSSISTVQNRMETDTAFALEINDLKKELLDS